MSKKKPPHSMMLNLMIGHWVSRLIQVAAKLKLADHLKGGPRTADELAAIAGVRVPQLYRVLRALASVGVWTHLVGIYDSGPNRIYLYVDCTLIGSAARQHQSVGYSDRSSSSFTSSSV